MSDDVQPEAGAPPALTLEQVAGAEALAGLEFTPDERALMMDELAEHLAAYAQIRTVPLLNSVPPALVFDPRRGLAPAPPPAPTASKETPAHDQSPPAPPADLEDLAFAPVTLLAALLRSGQVTSLALTEMYLRRLRRYDPLLHCVVTLTEELARAQARQADAEIAAGRYRGPLHGIPWGAKDLLATRGIPTTWGATPYREQMIDAFAGRVYPSENQPSPAILTFRKMLKRTRDYEHEDDYSIPIGSRFHPAHAATWEPNPPPSTTEEWMLAHAS